MSVSIYCQAHLHGESQEIEVDEILNRFSPFVSGMDESGFDVVYDELNSSHIFMDMNADKCSEFSVNRPCGDRRLYDAIYKCMSLGNFIVYRNDSSVFYITNESTIQHLPADMKEFVESEEAELRIISSGEALI